MRNRQAAHIPDPVLRKLGTGKYWVLDDPYELNISGMIFTIPAGFAFDLATVPEVLHWLIDEDELGAAAPLIHDVCYRYRGDIPIELCSYCLKITRKEADDLLYYISILSGASPWRARAAWLAVRMFARRW